MHTIDLLLSELFIAVFWFNPVSWLIRKSIVLNHEYLADNVTIHKTVSIREYQYRLLNIPAGLRTIPLAHNFNSNIKNRIIMINRKPSRRYSALKNLLILPVVAIMFAVFSFKPETGLSKIGYQEPLFSGTSQNKILKFINDNVIYPQEARSSFDTGRVFVVIKMNKGGTIKESKAFTEKNGITVPILDEVVIVGYGSDSGSGKGTINSNYNAKNEHPALKAECLRVANKLVGCEIAECKEKNMEFALAFKFELRSNRTAIRPDLENSLFILNGVEKTREDFDKLDIKNIARISVLKDSSAISKYGEKGKNGAIEVITKK
jgi:hypothetical protein